MHQHITADISLVIAPVTDDHEHILLKGYAIHSGPEYIVNNLETTSFQKTSIALADDKIKLIINQAIVSVKLANREVLSLLAKLFNLQQLKAARYLFK